MTRKITVGGVAVGGGADVSVQSMTNTKTSDAAATLNQINALSEAGCDIVRCSVPDAKSASALSEICKKSPLPVVADIHFDHKLAIVAVRAGVSKVRINPGNIGGPEKVRELVSVLKEYKIPVRIGVNAGSLEKGKTMLSSALSHIKILENEGFFDIAVSVKASNVKETVEAYRALSKICDYPLHLGVTEAGTYEGGLVKSAAALGALLLDGIGDTVRVSLAGDPVREVLAAKKILRAVGLDKNFVNVIACPTCARTEIDVEGMARRIEEATSGIKKPLTVAVMGCIVNGLGEGKHADLGIAGGRDKSILFKKGVEIGTVSNENALETLMEMVKAETDCAMGNAEKNEF